MALVVTFACGAVALSGHPRSTGHSRKDRHETITARFQQPRTLSAAANGSGFEAHFVAKPALTEGPVVRVAAGGHSQVDPIAANGPIFVDWPKPDLALVFTGEQMGFLEPCGCAGLENQKGGFKRRYTMMRQLREQGWPLVAMDAGGLIRRYGPQAQIKLHWSLEGLTQMEYAAIGLGGRDLKLDILSEAVNLDPNPLLSANLGIVDFESGFTRRFRVVEQAGYKIGMTSVLGATQTKGAASSRDLVTMPPAEAIEQVLPELRRAECDELVLLVYGTVEQAKELAEQFPDFNWIVAGQGGDEPPNRATPLNGGKQQLIEVGHKGMYAVVLGLYRQGEPSWRYQKVPLDHRFEDAPEMQQLLVKYQQQLKTIGFAGLGLHFRNQAVPETGFAGNAACADCHLDAWEVFEKSPHAHATQTLVDLKPARHFDPECLSCHVTGWDAQGYAPYASGYVSLEKTPHLTTNGCENCHGPGQRHVDLENGDLEGTDEQIEAARAALRMKIVENEGNQDGQVIGQVVDNCMKCHDLDNSPDFDFQKYWDERVRHKGKY